MSKRILTVIGLLLAAACAHRGQPDIATLSSNSDQVIWEAGQKALKKKQWESARQHLRRIIDGFPQSEYGPGARLALGKSYLDEGGTANAILAASAYRDFLTLYPSHPQSDHAQFQVGEAFFKQKNGPDRDQTPIQQALEEYQKLLELHPGSAHAEKARGRLRECRESLARSEFMVGHFYQRTRQAHRAAIARYEGILRDYPDYSNLAEVLFRLAEALHLADRSAEALPHLARIGEEYPKSPFAAQARTLTATISARRPALGPDSPSPSPSAVPTPDLK
ncbi:MAG TPA: outer membrane protein assembly factor BamD [Vicinamibacteria bacterium]|nr:outer membrane protein assembly factor BamD [Vicinamibacteria bacterium]